MQVTVSRLTTLAIQFQNKRESGVPQLEPLQQSLGQLLEILLQWSSTEVRKCGTHKSGPLMRHYTQGEAQFVSQRPLEAGAHRLLQFIALPGSTLSLLHRSFRLSFLIMLVGQR